jgi:tRNA (guanine37-N1)-methyltransferase
VRFDIITLFPELFAPHLTQGVTRRAFAVSSAGQTPGVDSSGSTEPALEKIEVKLWPLREHAEGTYRRVDDRPFGGGPGMVMLAEPLLRALDAVQADRQMADQKLADQPAPAVVHFSPTGRRIDQALVQEFAAGPGAVLLCGRYEGIDQRVLDARVTHELSLGDFVLSGGELPALALLDAVARLQDGVLTESSHQQDSFSDGLLEGPHYSRPEHLQITDAAGSEATQRTEGTECSVPAVLLSGNHAAIALWRRQKALQRTAQRRPELITAARTAGRLSRADEAYLATLGLYS